MKAAKIIRWVIISGMITVSSCVIFGVTVSFFDWWPEGLWPKETFAGRPINSYRGMKVGMTEEQVLLNAYQDNSFFGCASGDKYERRRWSPAAAVVKEDGILYWVRLDSEGKEKNREAIADSQIENNTFFKRLGFQYPRMPVESKVLIFKADYPYAYVYFDGDGIVTAIFTGGS